MAHAAPTPGRPVIPGRPSAPARPAAPATPDVFSERTHALANRILPVVLGLVYGYWAAAMNRDAGPITGWNLLFGFVTAFVFAALHTAVLTVAPRLRRELRAAVWAAFAGCAFGFLYSQASQHSVLRCAAMSLAVAAGFLAANFYRYYTHEDATGHRLR
ncbi:hypothetical protein ACSCB1_41515 [Streptomyces europaeiscabiei]|uniref:Integral membrane protein n=1 Tax=Streptomyces europaeiscabiei TaxID=146819 RepID=A0ABU4NI74_9ACTN|nr:hypothetical protein [Streptomyces europaeiscabiei]MDX2527643.1 hypothetical protein [Streptomyces europaeiscabiei]MDX2766590.1 hypothetical protein [Streptomyces europaeiscabiei]MDX3545089.1 hypothetical protein [Streptomyces europaeiscabiei]MDX3554777.1 hypothetical protein [Streptomyces europaeiscabiei]MDX3671806.1 hypothetical protein [Streptomyces europaeiscabiei]